MSHERSPFDIELTYSGTSKSLLLARDETGGLLFKPIFLPELAAQQRTDAFSYQHRSPIVDIPASFERWTLGAGFEDAPPGETAGFKGYNFSRGVDVSFGSRGYISPGLQTGGTVTSTTPKKFLQADLGVFVINDRYVYEWTGSAWTERYDVGAGGFLNDIFEYTNATDNYLVLGRRGDSFVYSVDGVVWTSSSASSAPAFRADSVQSGTSSTALTITAPVGIADNDILVAVICPSTGTSGVTPPSGFNLLFANTSGTGTTMHVYWKRAASESGNYQFTWTGTGDAIGYMAAYSGCITTGNPIESGSSTADSNAAPSVTTTGSNRTVMAVYVQSASAITHTPPTGYTEREDSSGGNKSISINDKTEASATSTGTLTVTPSSGTAAVAGSWALIPVPPTVATDVARFDVRGQSSGEPVLWAINSKGDMRNATSIPGTWSAADSIQAGEDNRTIAGMNVVDGNLYVWHDRGITSYNGTAVSTVFSARTMQLASDAARPYVHSDGNLYGTFSNALLRYKPVDGTLEKVWPRGPQVGNAELNGTITAITGDERDLYFVVKNSAGGYYLMKCDPNITATVDGQTITPVHTLYYHGTNAINAILLCKASSDALSSTNPHIVIGDAASADYLILPKPGLRPEDDSAVRFDAAGGTLTGSFVDFRAQGFPKWLTRGDIEGASLSASKTVALRYQTPGGSATTIATATTDGRTTATLTPVSFTTVRETVVLATSGATVSPVLKGTVLHAAPNAPRDRGWLMTVRLRNDQPTNHAAVQDKKDTKNTSAWIRDAVNQLVTFRDPYGDSYSVKVIDVETVDFRYGHDNKVEEKLQITLGQLTS